MKYFANIVWYIGAGLALFFMGAVYQWYFNKHPESPLAVVDPTLDSAKGNVAETLHILGLRKPSHYHQTSLSAADQFVDRSAAQSGLTLLTGVGSDALLEAKVVEPDGGVVQHWNLDWFETWPDAGHLPETFEPKQRPGTNIHGATIMDNGDLIFNFEYQGLVRMDACGEVVWRLPYQTHHSIFVDEETGHLWVSGKKFHEEPVARLPNHRPPFAEPTVLEISSDGEILNEISVFDILYDNDMEGLLQLKDFSEILHKEGTTTGDTLHLNDVDVFPSDLPAGQFKPGDVMISLRNIHTVLVFDPESLEITFANTGDVIGQHDPDFVDGDTISVFDNHVTSAADASQRSRVLMLKAPDGEAEVYYEGTESHPFYTDVMGKHQWLENGNLLLTEATKGRAFEVDRDGRVVWQLINFVEEDDWVGELSEAQRLPASFDSQFFEQQRKSCSPHS